MDRSKKENEKLERMESNRFQSEIGIFLQKLHDFEEDSSDFELCEEILSNLIHLCEKREKFPGNLAEISAENRLRIRQLGEVSCLISSASRFTLRLS